MFCRYFRYFFMVLWPNQAQLDLIPFCPESSVSLSVIESQNSWWNPVYCSWSTNNYPPPLIFCFVFRLGLACPAGLGKMFSSGPAGSEPPQGLELGEKRKIESQEGGSGRGICARRSKQGIVQTVYLIFNKSNFHLNTLISTLL